ncbi:hypothetical protein CKO42_25500 [Lamprobacter modestohalophilus]|uniref:Uncharacterized protein n=2 Tax=Lamprobacter modestohalophilus TaxID=1064514 RepID=A0A9X0WDU3_9GAMM|nr:hypothetical protein [Lamprobacter modestohalophilus]
MVAVCAPQLVAGSSMVMMVSSCGCIQGVAKRASIGKFAVTMLAPYQPIGAVPGDGRFNERVKDIALASANVGQARVGEGRVVAGE